jgi:Fe2+ or Zn2+ uptake regulation protein
MPDDLDELEAEIARYVQEHGHAAETAEGAHRHWLPEHATWTLDQVREVLRRMSSARVLERHALPGGATLYRKKRSDVDE